MFVVATQLIPLIRIYVTEFREPPVDTHQERSWYFILDSHFNLIITGLVSTVAVIINQQLKNRAV